jgi:hypothetical protein
MATDPVSLFPDFKEFLKLMNSGDVRYLVVGGYAVNYHGHHRTTGDLDVWIAVDPDNAARISAVLQEFGFSPENVPAAAFLERGKIFRMGVKPVRIELLTQPSGVDFDDCYARRIVDAVDGVTIPLISLDDLKANKRAAARTKDLADLENLPPAPTPVAKAASRAKRRRPRRK